MERKKEKNSEHLDMKKNKKSPPAQKEQVNRTKFKTRVKSQKENKRMYEQEKEKKIKSKGDTIRDRNQNDCGKRGKQKEKIKFETTT